MRIRLLSLTAAAALLLSACATTEPDQAGSTSTVGATASPSATGTETPAPTGTPTSGTGTNGNGTGTNGNGTGTGSTGSAGELQENESSATAPANSFTTDNTQGGMAEAGGDLLPVAVRTGEHEDITRVVVEFTGETSPGWAAGYVDEAIEAGRGHPIDVPGQRILAVTLRGLAYPESDSPAGSFASGDIAPATDRIAGMHLDPMFEGQATLFIGLDDTYAYQVTTLPDPQRVVIDIRTGNS